eukprot:759614-Ditylum_brightwellii.AAC.1
MRTSLSDDDGAPPWPPPNASPCSSPLPETTFDDQPASLNRLIEKQFATNPSHAASYEHIMKEFWGQNHKFWLCSVLRKLQLTVHRTPLVLIRTSLPPSTQA